MTRAYLNPHASAIWTWTPRLNMGRGGLPRTDIVLAPGRQVQLTVVDVPADLLTSATQRGRRELFACRLARRLGLGRPRTRERAETVLEEATREALQAAQVAGAAVCTNEGSAPSVRYLGLPPLLAVAVVSRCAGNLFLRDRCPRFDHTHLKKKVSFYRGNEPWKSIETDSQPSSEPQKPLEAEPNESWKTYPFNPEIGWE